MRAMLLRTIAPVAEGASPLDFAEVPTPAPAPGEILVRVRACGVCHTELDEIEGRTPPPRLPVIPGHQIVGTVAALGLGATRHRVGDRVGIAWIHSACGACAPCLRGEENLCTEFRATGRDADGGYAEYTVVPEGFVYPVPASLTDEQAAPLLCAGAVGYRALRLTGLTDGGGLGLMGFGASAHIALKVARRLFPASRIHAFTRSPGERDFARELGAVWAGDIADPAPEALQAIIDTTPAWRPVVESLKNLAPGGRLVVNAIRKEDGDRDALLGLDYARDLWMEKGIKSVANVTRRDVMDLLALAAEIGLDPEVQVYPLEDANRALVEMKTRRIRGAKVLRVG
jgi:alcohol dehydrogenase, propanol-preferring